MNQIYLCLKGKLGIGIKVVLLGLVLTAAYGRSFGQTNNYFGASGTVSGNVWSTIPAGPYTSALNTTGGAIMNFNNTATATYASFPTTVGMNFGAVVTWTAAGTIGAAGINLPINVSPGISENLGGQSFSASATAAFTKNGAGELAEAGGAFGGGFTLNAGTLAAGGVNAMGSGGTLTINGGTISGTATRTFAGKYTGGITVTNDFGLGASTGASLGTAGLTFTNNTAFGAATRTITLGGTGIYAWSGIISGTGAAGLGVSATAAGTLLLGGLNNYPGSTTVNGGTLACAIGGTIPSTSNIILNGGKLSTGLTTGYTQSVGTLGMTASSTLALGTGSHSITFLGNTATWTGTLTITGWAGVAGSSGTAGKVIITGAGLSTAQLAQITFSGFSPGAVFIGNELVPAVTSFTTAQNGPWTTPATWQGGVVPATSDNVVINHAVTTGALTRDPGTTTLINTGASLAASGTYTDNGTTTVNGTFQLDGGGFANGNNLVYAATGSYLVFNGGSVYGVNGTPTYWPTTSGPYNVTVNTGSGLDLQAGVGARTINGILSAFGQVNVSTPGYLVIAGTLQLNANGYISANSPNYSSGSTLQYNSGGTYSRNFEWSSVSPTVGTPYNVLISSSTTLNYPSGTVSAQTITNNLTINSSSALYMDYGAVNSNGALTVGNNISLIGSLSEGNTNGDDIYVGGNMAFTAGYGFFPNGRAVIFTKNGTQVISTSGTTPIPPTFAYLNISPTTAGTVQLGAGADITIAAPNTGNALSFTNTGDILDLNGHTLTIGTTGVANTITGPGSFKGTVASNLTLLGTGSIGTLKFTTGFQNLGTLTLNRTAAAVAATLGTDLTINTSTVFTNGLLNVSTNNLIFAAAAISSGASANSFAEADGTGTVRKTFTAIGSFTYPVGDGPGSANGAEYSPATLNFTAGSFTAAYAGINVTNLKHPNNAAPTDYINRYWSVSSSGITSPTYNFTGTYTNADIAGTETNSYSGRWDGSTWTLGSALAANTVSVTGNTSLTATNDYSGGNPFAAPLVTITNTGTPAAANIGTGVSNVLLTTFNISSNYFTDLTSVTLTNSGTATSSDLSNVRIIYDANSNGILDAGEITGSIAGTSMPYAGSITFPITGQSTYAGSHKFFVIADVAAGATAGDYVTSSIVATTDVTTSVTNKTGSAIGNQQTIAAISLASDYFISNGSGIWATPATWLSSHDNITYFPATLAPTSAANTITVAATHTIAVTSSITADQLIINGVVEIQAGGIINLNDGASDDITINSGGILRTLGAAAYTTEMVYGGSSNIHVLSGGKITIGVGGAVVGGGQAGYGYSTTNNLWDNNAVFEWNTTNAFNSANAIYFPSASANIPVFRVSAPCSVGAGTPTTFNGKLEVNANLAMTGTGDKICRNGILGTATLTVASANIKITAASAVLDGTSLRINNSLPMNLSSSVTVPTGAVVSMTGSSTIDNNTTPGNLTVNGTLDLGTETITNGAGSITVNGTMRTAYTGVGGLTGTNGAIPAGTVNLNNTISTVEYYAAATQYVTNRNDYFNLIISNGAKTLATTTAMGSIGGTVTVNAGASLDVSNTTFGGVTTNLTLVGNGKFMNAGSGSKPDIGGTYTLGTGSTVEFDGTAATLVRYQPYYNLYITGTNVSTSTTGNITLQAGGTFTLAAGATFKTRSSTGFSGGPTTTINNVNSPTIIVSPTSTVDYSEPAAQTITNQVPYGNLMISAASGTKTAPAGTLSILGNITKSGAAPFAHNNGTVTLDGTTATTQTYTAVDSMDFYKLVNNNTNGGFTVGSTMGVQNLLTLSANSKLIFGSGNISIRSSAANTAAVDAVPTTASITYSGSGRFRIERYVTYLRKWQLLSVPVTDNVLNPTFKSAWMEGSAAANDNLAPGYGMQITDALGTALGFDATSYTPSVKSYLPVTNTYLGIATPSLPMAIQSGYFAFVRGDRTSLNTNSLLIPTKLRTTGKIQTGNITVSDPTAIAGLYQVIGNPYPSALNLASPGITMSNTTSSNGKGNVYVWDPTIAGNYGLGKFVLLSYDGTNYTADDNTGLYNSTAVTNYLQSGQAFLVQSSLAAGSVTFTEASKDQTGGTATVNFIPGSSQTLRTNLYTLNDGVHANGADGTLVFFGDNMNSGLDHDDAEKMLNTSDNLALATGGKLLGIERRHTVTGADTLHLDITTMHIMGYRFIVSATNMDAPGRTGSLVDRFTGLQTPLSLTGNTQYDFNVTADAASYAHDRFMIIFKQQPKPVFISVAAFANPDKTIAVNWKVGNENSVNLYHVERSANGVDFTEISSSGPMQNNNAVSVSYAFTDAQPLQSDNYFRIKMMLNSGAFVYSDIVKVNRLSNAVYVSVSPNPVSDRVIHIQMSNQLPGNYAVQLLNTAGQIVYAGTVTVTGYSENKNIPLSQNIVAGVYSLSVTGPDGKKSVVQVLIR